ncbi:MAG: S24/S26 family peptidase [Rikenellaceae bacterium]|jgi:hypothetical protein|nr:S24/S26 family peptidase [Rikenellaceae bacterium]
MKTMPNNALFEAAIDEIGAGRSVLLRCGGNSMRPFLHDGRDVIELAPCTPEQIVRGAVVLYNYRGQYMVHRIVRLRADGRCECMGDGNLRTETILTSDVMAVMRSVRRRNGRTVLCRSASWQWHWRLWAALRPVRRILLKIDYLCRYENRRQA